MDQVDRLYLDLIGRDRGLSSTLSTAGQKAGLAHEAIGKLSGTLSNIGGPFAQAQMLAGSLSDSFDTLHEHGKSLSTMLTATGLGMAGLGVALTGFASADQQAQSQLRQSIDNTGRSYSDYERQVQEAIHTQEGFGHAADDTQNALAALTTASQDPAKALRDLGLAADIAGAKHESLAEAAHQVILMEQGQARAFLSFGIQLDKTKSKTDAVNDGLRQLGDRVRGQDAAAVDSFGGRLKVAGVRLEDMLASLGKYGPVLTAAGAALTVYAALMQRSAAAQVAETAALSANTAAQAANAAARAANTGAAVAETAAATEAAAAQTTAMGRLAQFAKFAPLAGVGAISDMRSSIPHTSEMDAMLLQASRIEKALHGEQQHAAVSAFNSMSLSGPDATKRLGDWIAQYGKLVPAAARAATATNQYATALGNLDKKQNEATDAAVRTKLSFDSQLKSLQANQQAAAAVGQTQDAVTTAMNNLAQSVHDNGNALSGHTAAAIANRDALRQVAQAELAVLSAMHAAGASDDQVRLAAINMSRAVDGQAASLLGNKSAVDNLLRSLGVLGPAFLSTMGSLEVSSEQMGATIINAMNAAVAGTVNAVNAAVMGQQALKLTRWMAAADAGGGGGTSAGGSFTPHPATTPTFTAPSFTVPTYTPPPVTAGSSGGRGGASGQVTAAQQKIAAARQKMTADVQTVEGYYRQLRDALVNTANLANRATMTDSLGTQGGQQSVRSYLREQAHQMQEFARLYKRLEREGLAQGLLDQLAQQGPAAIPAMREMLASGRKGIRADDRYYREVQNAAGVVARTATQEHYNRLIATDIHKFPKTIEEAMVKALRRAGLASLVAPETQHHHHKRRHKTQKHH